MADAAIDILGLDSVIFVEEARQAGVPRTDALAIYRRAFREGLVGDTRIALRELAEVRSLDEGVTRKLALALEDGLEVETVILPQQSKSGRWRSTLCVSSQVGCAMGCGFCETAQMGLLRRLSAGEIVAQWWAARWRHDASISNIVFMGMGEPLDNVEAVIGAIRVLADQNGPAVAPSRVSVSTVGRTKGIERLSELAREPGFRQLRLAVSVNAPNDDIRSQIMPINRAEPMADLMDAMLAWPGPERTRILIEYVLIPGVNDAFEHADELAEYLRPLRCTVNVIPYNPRRDSPWPAATPEDADRFVARLEAAGQFTRRRRTFGRSVMGACGQLGNPGVRRRRFVDLGAPTAENAASSEAASP